jgi:hypothetical protein
MLFIGQDLQVIQHFLLEIRMWSGSGTIVFNICYIAKSRFVWASGSFFQLERSRSFIHGHFCNFTWWHFCNFSPYEITKMPLYIKDWLLSSSSQLERILVHWELGRLERAIASKSCNSRFVTLDHIFCIQSFFLLFFLLFWINVFKLFHWIILFFKKKEKREITIKEKKQWVGNPYKSP